jgi:hypothetical protein
MKKKIDAVEIMQDIKSGLGDVPVMEKYDLAPSEYIRILEKLQTLKGGEGQEAARRLSSADWNTIGFEARRTRRCYLVLSVLAYDSREPETRGLVQDLTEKGFQITGPGFQPKEIREFVFQSEASLGYWVPFVVKAQCKWTSTEPTVSGFEIVKISPKDLEELKKLIDLMAICDIQ